MYIFISITIDVPLRPGVVDYKDNLNLGGGL